ncbi:hypothetical protein [Dinghuibacter silviterrae]|uniref:Polyhydroxyalkanoic acid system protein n=1 Tax=Dinghuibacter silviterrae TaxID=1539049 RepID=A0A4R8DI43_9BACT|nr:hypothetical protein [Dinghuibacter silviterrae]TDW96610.1 hypothetical protein EDB95_4443 [Dinghuibacter silviterrae]
MCDFTFPMTTSPESLVEKMSKSISGIGGTLTGDAKAGQFQISTPVGKITGSYQLADQNLQIHIEEKPFFLSCGQIEGQLKKALEGA